MAVARWIEDALVKYMRENHTHRKLFTQLMDNGLVDWSFHQLIRIMKDPEQIQSLLFFLEKSYITEHFVEAMGDAFIRSKLKIFDALSLENPLEEFNLQELNELICNNYQHELERWSKEAAFTVIAPDSEAQNPVGDSIQEALPIIEFHKRGGYRVTIRTKVEDDLKLLINMRMSAGKKDLEKQYNEKSVKEMIQQIAKVNATVPNGYYFMKKGDDNNYTVNYQVSYYVMKYEFDEELFQQYLSAGMSNVKKHGLL